MKIGFDAKRLFNNFTGLGNYSRTLLSNLVTQFPTNQYHLFTPGISDHKDVAPFLNREKFHIHQPKKSFKSIWRSFGIPADLKKQGIQIYHGLSHEIPFGIKKTGIPTVVTIHDLVFKRQPDFYPFIDRKIYDLKFRYACENVDAVVAISESTKRDIVEFYNIRPEKIKVIYQTCHDRFKIQLGYEEKKAILEKYNLPSNFMLYVGSVVERKNLLGIVRAMEQLPDSLRLPLVVVGKGKKYLEKVKQYLAKSSIEKHIIFPERIEFSDLPAIYQRSKIFIYPSYFEGFGIPVIEALYSNIPVITSNLSSLPEAGGPASWYVNPDSCEDIACCIERVLTENDLREKLLAEGKKYVARFDKEVVTREMMEVYRSLV